MIKKVPKINWKKTTKKIKQKYFLETKSIGDRLNKNLMDIDNSHISEESHSLLDKIYGDFINSIKSLDQK